MKILITMAGQGSRFREVGISKPKHEIRVKGEPMFDWAMRSLDAFFGSEFIFITQDDHSPTPFLERACKRLGIENYRELTLSEYTEGQATTAVTGDGLIGDRESVAIYNIDTYIQEGVLSPDLIHGDGFIPTFSATGTRWSFVRTDSDGHVTEVSEKDKISDTATAGFYYFDRWTDFVEAYRRHGDEVANQYGETYVAPLYNHLIDSGNTVVTHQIPREAIHVLGTPEDLKQFDSSFDPDKKV